MGSIKIGRTEIVVVSRNGYVDIESYIEERWIIIGHCQEGDQVSDPEKLVCLIVDGINITLKEPIKIN